MEAGGARRRTRGPSRGTPPAAPAQQQRSVPPRPAQPRPVSQRPASAPPHAQAPAPHFPTPRRPAPAALPEPHPVAANFVAVARGVALFLGVFSLFNLLGELRAPGFDANLWWIDLRPCPVKLARGFLAISAVLLTLFAMRPTLPRPIRLAAMACVALLLVAAAYNATVYYALVKRGTLHTTVALPFSVHVSACLAIILIALRLRPPETTTVGHAFLGATTTVCCLVGFPLAQMYCFGHTDYRRQADAIIVFGCKVNSNDRPSWALYDRMKTACDLYAAGLAKVVIVSGGPGEGSAHETDIMKEIAIASGIPESAIVVDREGLDTAATVTNTIPMLRDREMRRVLAVSHFYHLPRIKLTYRRAGLDVFTVPAKETHRLQLLPFYLAREVAALWTYYFRPPRG